MSSPSDPLIRRRPSADSGTLPADLHPVLRRIYAARGLRGSADVDLGLARLLPPQMLGLERAAQLLDAAIDDGRAICVCGDYDADGATGTALAVLGLRALGARRVDYVVPDRISEGYGLSPGLVARARALGAELLLTVDNGIVAHAGVEAARAAGLLVVISDHHLAGDALPDADAVVDPNQPGCPFPSKVLAGVGVVFYLLTALRALRRQAGKGEGPHLAQWLDLVALGTVADVVPLDHNNRILVAQGLARMRSGRTRPGLAALLEVAGRQPALLAAADLGFALGPRLNAAGRLDDMATGIECLLTDDPQRARLLAGQLDGLNRQRREIETRMRDEALADAQIDDPGRYGICAFDASWHEGVVGLVASRLRERCHRPTFAFAPAAEPGLLKGSGRSVRGFHLRDALALIDARQPGLLGRYGGHAMAAGLSLRRDDYPAFVECFDAVCREGLDAEALQAVIETDGELTPQELVLDTALALEAAGPWGQGFPEPCFEGQFLVDEARPVGADGRHVAYRLRLPDGGASFRAIHFDGAEQTAQGRLYGVYRLVVNRFRQQESAELQLLHVREKLESPA